MDYRNDNVPAIYGVRVSQTGATLDSFSILGGSGARRYAALATAIGGRTLLAYPHWTERIGSHAVYTNRIWGSFAPTVSAVRDRAAGLSSCTLRVSPNPVANASTITYALPESRIPAPGSRIPFSLRLYDVTGKLITTLAHGSHIAGTATCSLRPATYRLARGVYILKLETADSKRQTQTTTAKLIVE